MRGENVLQYNSRQEAKELHLNWTVISLDQDLHPGPTKSVSAGTSVSIMQSDEKVRVSKVGSLVGGVFCD